MRLGAAQILVSMLNRMVVLDYQWMHCIHLHPLARDVVTMEPCSRVTRLLHQTAAMRWLDILLRHVSDDSRHSCW